MVTISRSLRVGEKLPKIFYLVASSPGHLRSQCLIFCGSSLQRGHSGSAEESTNLAYAFNSGVWPARICMIANRSAIFGPAKTFGDRALSGGSISVLRMRDLADALEMGLGGLLVTVAVVLVSVSASSLPGIPLWSGTHKRVAS